MVFNEIKTDDVSVLVAADWNEFVDYTEDISSQTYWISGNYIGHSGNKTIHFTSGSIKDWTDSLYTPSGVSGVGSGAITLSSGLTSDSTLYNLGSVTDTYLEDIPQSVLKSGSEYWKSYLSGQLAIYSETYSSEGDLTSVLDDDYAPSSGYHTHTLDNTKHYTSGSVKTWMDGLYAISGDYLTEIEADALYAPTGTSESTGSGALTLSSGLTSDSSLFNVGTATNTYLDNIPESVIKSGANWSKSYASAQIAIYTDTDTHPGSGQLTATSPVNIDTVNAYVIGEAAVLSIDADSVTQAMLKSGAEYNKAYISAQVAIYTDTDTHPGSGQLTATSPITISEANTYVIGATADLGISADSITQVMLKSGAEYNKAYESGQIALYSETYPDEASLTTVLDDNYTPSTTAHGLYAPSGDYNTHKSDSTIHFTKATIDDDYAPSALTATHYTEYVNHSGNTSNPHDVVWSDVSTAAKIELDDDYYPSGLGKIVSGALYTHTGDATIHFTLASIEDNFAPSSNIPQGALKSGSEYWKAYASAQIALYVDSDTFPGSGLITLSSGLTSDDNIYHIGPATDLFIPSSTYWNHAYESGQVALYIETYSDEASLTAVLDDDYAPSSTTKSHIDDATLHFTVASIDDNYYPSSLGNTLKTSYDNHSGQTNKHIDHSGVDITAGDGLTGGGSITETRTLTVVGGTGITANANDIEVTAYDTISSNAKKGQSSGAIALYTETYADEASLTSVLNDDYAPSTASHGLYAPSSSALNYISGADDTNISSPVSGHILTWDGSDWENKMPSMTFNIANIRMSAQQNINVTRFTCPASKKCYIWQACACNSGSTSVADLSIEMLSGTTSVYSTSSATLQEGNPLAVSDGGETEIRFMYSGGTASGIEFGTGFMNISVF